MIHYTDQISDLTPDQLKGFFVGWSTAPSPEKHLKILQQSDYAVVAMEGAKVVGFVNALSEGILSAYIPLLEVLPEYQNHGIGRELMQRIFKHYEGFYMIDCSSEASAIAFYAKLGMTQGASMFLRNH